jgi:hypothetical protein
MVPGHGWLARPYGNACRRSPGSRDRDREIKLDKVSPGVSRLRNSTEGGGEEAKRVLVAQELLPGNLRSGVGGSGRWEQ